MRLAIACVQIPERDVIDLAPQLSRLISVPVEFVGQGPEVLLACTQDFETFRQGREEIEKVKRKLRQLFHESDLDIWVKLFYEEKFISLAEAFEKVESHVEDFHEMLGRFDDSPLG